MTNKRRMTKFARSQVGQEQPVYVMVAGEVVKVSEAATLVKAVSEADQTLLATLDVEFDEIFLSKRA